MPSPPGSSAGPHGLRTQSQPPPLREPPALAPPAWLDPAADACVMWEITRNLPTAGAPGGLPAVALLPPEAPAAMCVCRVGWIVPRVRGGAPPPTSVTRDFCRAGPRECPGGRQASRPRLFHGRCRRVQGRGRQLGQNVGVRTGCLVPWPTGSAGRCYEVGAPCLLLTGHSRTSTAR